MITEATVKQFLSKLFYPEEQVFFFPLMREEIMVAKGKEWSSVAAVSTSLRSKQFSKQIAKLVAFNHAGYDIYTCPNPLAFNKHSKRTVTEVRTLVIESDDPEQRDACLAFAAAHRSSVRCVVDTGRRSIHVHIALDPISNPYCLHRWQAKIDGKGITLPAYDAAIQLWQAKAQAAGIQIDQTVLANFGGLVRVPWFAHPITGKVASLVAFATCALIKPVQPVASLVASLVPVVVPALVPVAANPFGCINNVVDTDHHTTINNPTEPRKNTHP